MKRVPTRVLVQRQRRVFDGFFKIDEAEVSNERFDGSMGASVKRLSFERGDSVAALVHDRRARTVMLVNQFKYPTYAKGPGWILETVAGILEPGETPEAAVRREVLEEIGYELDVVEPIATFFVSPGGSSERILLFYAETSSARKVGPGGGLASENEDIETVELEVDDLERLVRDGAIVDAKTLVAILWLQKRLGEAGKGDSR
jgi:nudix-type nucleoside diphosphatase (YffH/AdpP family)